METSNNSIIGDTVLGSKWLNPDYLFSQGVIFFNRFLDFINSSHTEIISVYQTFLFFFAFFFLIIISYTSVRIFEIRAKERKHLEHEIAEYARLQAEKERKMQEGDAISKNPRWIQTLTYLFSQHASDWKLAVIEADSMLDSLMDQLGFKGDNLGDKLKEAAQPVRQLAGGENFRGLNAAWEAHTIRNRIAHEGVNFELSQHEAKRVIAIYEQIFRGYGYI